MVGRKTKVLLEMRPALEGFAGIPQEVRLLFNGLRKIDTLEVEGMLQTSHRFLSAGATKKTLRKPNKSRLINRYSKVIVSMAEAPHGSVFDRVARRFRRKMSATTLAITSSLGMNKIELGLFKSAGFHDFVWRTLFDKSLSNGDFRNVVGADFRVCSVPWHTMHLSGLNTLGWSSVARYPRLETGDFQLFIGQTPYPGKISRNTKMVIRYHDAIPVLMPHTIPDKSIHQATHFHALQANVKAGAWFACVSEATRRDLLELFPEAEKRSVTIHNMVSSSYFPEDAAPDKVPGIIRSRLHEGDKAKGVDVNPTFLTNAEREAFYRKHLEANGIEYLLIVSTLEPRKNHAKLLAAWEQIKKNEGPKLKLVIVGGLGWDYAPMLRRFSSWIERGELFLLSGVPSADLRTLYRNAKATVCPSLGEGFDFSGVEAMRSGGIVIASDIAVHKEVYDDAAIYFDPYSTGDLTKALRNTLYGSETGAIRQSLVAKGNAVSSRYLPENILPKWQDFIARIM
ncbi:glycosyltransferase family 4 protein [Sphingobium chlorophenolicum]|uniref:Glycosyl transferase, group 1 n=1 Tax=Sphingobium chlorophenolicum TaxID=46429 RepID=A0A081RGP7_SPHCR|nr:glycosyltransferase family 1 protein [Sphingobium chlorophenolicum]KEQ54370.1 Glycosyl transferase, group 1 [Sphingobium chlorophenolicum]